MKSRISKVFLAVILCIPIMAGCSSLRVKNSSVEHFEGVNSQVAEVIARPYEVGIKQIGEEVQGEASHVRVLGFTVEGKNIDVNAPLINVNLLSKPHDRSAAVAEAILKIIENTKSDGLLVMNVSIERTAVWPLYVKEKATVKGRPIKVEMLGQLPADRADKLREHLGKTK